MEVNIMVLMELQIKYFLWLLSFVLLLNCNSNVKNPPNVLVEVPSNGINNDNGTWFYNKEKFNGYLIEKRNNKMISKLPIMNGKENGIGYGWFENGKRRYQRQFLNGNRAGNHFGWFDNGNIAFINTFHNDKFEGAQKTFYKNGKMSQLLNFHNGYEVGKQKFWNQKGRLINNFTVKNGKLYGVIGRFDCMSVTTK